MIADVIDFTACSNMFVFLPELAHSAARWSAGKLAAAMSAAILAQVNMFECYF